MFLCPTLCPLAGRAGWAGGGAPEAPRVTGNSSSLSSTPPMALLCMLGLEFLT